MNDLIQKINACQETKGSSQLGPAPKCHSENVFFIHGARGAGKTTFLRYVLKNTENVRSLGLIDPTLIETREHILFVVLSCLDKMVREAAHCPCGAKLHEQEKENIYEKFRVLLKRMARGLSLLKETGEGSASRTESILDDFLMLNEKLENAVGGFGLQEQLREVFRYAGEILKVSTFLLGFDDIDTNFARGWDVLELLRCYFSHMPNLGCVFKTCD